MPAENEIDPSESLETFIAGPVRDAEDHARGELTATPAAWSAFTAAAVEREPRGQVLDEYLADYESRKGPVPDQARHGARQVFDDVFADEGQWPAASRRPKHSSSAT
ncbi:MULTISPECIES: DUF397 domain-containing protein [unclassified Streptomyces]|uniref:DUF397 domain-containing protein n=1 Tax=unclassified Streptomyces TaxID=2593676 RepID=UPI0033AE2AC1